MALRTETVEAVAEYLSGLSKLKALAVELAEGAVSEWCQDSLGEVHDMLDEQESAANGMLQGVGRA